MIDRFVQFVIRKYKYLLLRCSRNCYKNKDIVFILMCCLTYFVLSLFISLIAELSTLGFLVNTESIAIFNFAG